MDNLLKRCYRAVDKIVKDTDVQGDYIRFHHNYGTGQCWGAFGVIQEIVRHVGQDGQIYFHACLPPESAKYQVIAVFVSYAEKNPQRLHEDFFDVALDSLQQAFPCKKKKAVK